ncbi:MAG: DUF1844 domain-containing protein, partial [Desulfatiglandales bacterium]
MAEEGMQFKIKDRRLFDKDGRPREDAKEDTVKKEEPKEELRKESQERRIPLPPVTFSSLIVSLTSSVLMHFGDVPDPTTGERKVD